MKHHIILTAIFTAASVPLFTFAQQSRLHKAARKGLVFCIRLLIRAGADVNQRDKLGETPLHAAVQGKHRKAVNWLLKAGAHPNASSNLGLTPLHNAAITGDPTITQLLLEHGADVDALDCFGWTPLHTIAARGGVRIQRSITSNNNLVHYKKNWISNTYQTCFTRQQQKRANGTVDVEEAEPVLVGFTHTIFECAYTQKHHETANILLNTNAKVDTKDRFEHSLTVEAVTQNNTKLLKLLLDRAKTNDSELQSLLHPYLICLAISRANSEAVRVLLNAGAEIDAGEPHSPLEQALQFHDANTMRELFRRGALLLTEVSLSPNSYRCVGEKTYNQLTPLAYQWALEVETILANLALSLSSDVNCARLIYSFVTDLRVCGPLRTCNQVRNEGLGKLIRSFLEEPCGIGATGSQ